jgi:c-di-GMP-related signal transduction protein
MDTDKIAKVFVHKATHEMNLMTSKEKAMYLQGMIDMLDSIGDADQSQVYDCYRIRENIDEALEAKNA